MSNEENERLATPEEIETLSEPPAPEESDAEATETEPDPLPEGAREIEEDEEE